MINSLFYAANFLKVILIQMYEFLSTKPNFIFQTLTPSQSWVQCPPRQNGEVTKSNETKPTSHEMSTEL